jgi:hypothetical protein
MLIKVYYIAMLALMINHGILKIYESVNAKTFEEPGDPAAI